MYQITTNTDLIIKFSMNFLENICALSEEEIKLINSFNPYLRQWSKINC